MTPEALAIQTMFRIVDKDGRDVPFELNVPQKHLDDNITGRDIVPKARQRGVSSFFLARFTAACIIKRNVRAVVVSHESDATSRLLARCHYYANNMRGPNPEIGRSGLNIISFPKTNSEIYIGTAGSRKFGRGDTISHLLCSEYAYWPHPAELLNGLLDSVPHSGEVAIESTGNGIGNDYHRRALRAYQGQSQWKCHFLSWTDAEEYNIQLTEDESATVMGSLDEDLEEPQLVRDYDLTAGQIVWRRMKLEEKDFDLRLFKQEFPLTLDECFQAAGESLFYKVNYQETPFWKYQGGHLHVLEPHPMIGCTYVVGADPAGGSGGDNSCMEVFCLDTQEQVAEYAHNRVEPDVFGHKVADLAVLFNHAFVVVESNNHGPVTLDMLRRCNYPDILIYYMEQAGSAGYEDKTLMQMGFRTSSRTKPIMIGKLRSAISHDWTIHSDLLKGELSTFIEHESGALAAQKGCFDDRVMASACAIMGLERAGLYATPAAKREALTIRGKVYKDPFLLDSIIDELGGKGKGYPISPQNVSSWKGRPKYGQ